MNGWFGFHDPSKFGRIPDPPEPPECPEFWDEEMCEGCQGFDECKAEYERRCEDD